MKQYIVEISDKDDVAFRQWLDRWNIFARSDGDLDPVIYIQTPESKDNETVEKTR